MKYLHGFKLCEKKRRADSRNLYVNDKRNYFAIRNEVFMSIKIFLKQRFDDKEFVELNAIKHLPSGKEEELRKLHAAIVLDKSLADFVQACIEVGQMKDLNHSDLRLILQRILPDETMEPLQVALASIIAANPQSADVERLISSYNKIKPDGRNSIAPATLFKYMHIAINMPDLACFDFRSAPKILLQRKQRRFNHSAPNAGKQDWFKGVFECTTKVQGNFNKDPDIPSKKVSFR